MGLRIAKGQSMKTTALTIDNFIKIPHLRLKPAKQVVLIAGPNEAGKSSLAEAMRFLFLEDAPRVKYAKDRVLMIHGGARQGSVMFESGQHSLVRFVRDGKVQGDGGLLPGDPEAAAVCLQATSLTTMPEAKRRSLLMRLAKVDLSVDTIATALIEKGIDGAVVTSMRPLLKAGLTAAYDKAKREAQDARGAWREVTGETYGHVKAETWAPTAPVIAVDAAAQSLADIDAQLAELKADRDTKLDVLNAEAETQRADLQNAKDVSLAPLVSNIETYTQQLKKPTPLACPHCGGAVLLKSGDKGMELEKYDAVDKTALERMRSIAQMKHKQLADDFDGMLKNLAVQRNEAVVRVNGQFDAAAKGLAEDKTALMEQITTSERAQKKKTRAMELHRTAQTHDKLATLLSEDPEGVAAGLIREALKPLNERLMSIGLLLGWTPPAIHGDLSIVRTDGYGYNMLSRSAKWRIDAMLSVLVSELSGYGVLIFDELDILQVVDRGQFIQWLNDYAAERAGISVFVMATMKARPEVSSFPQIESAWIEGGKLA
jgi:energy-coupling factor transporter ATP-binding protein EcfA2